MASDEVSYQKRSRFGLLSAAFQWLSPGGFMSKPSSLSMSMAFCAAGPLSLMASWNPRSILSWVSPISPTLSLRLVERNRMPFGRVTGCPWALSPLNLSVGGILAWISSKDLANTLPESLDPLAGLIIFLTLRWSNGPIPNGVPLASVSFKDPTRSILSVL